MPRINEAFHSYIRSYEMGKEGELVKFLHPEHSYYAPGNTDKLNLEGRIEDEHYFFDGFSGIKAKIDDEIIDGERIAARITMTCKHTGSFHGIEATGRDIRISYIEILHFKDGLIIDEWAEFDMMNLMNQMKG